MKYLPEPYRIRVIEPVRMTTRTEREHALEKVGYNPFLLDSKDVFIDLLTDSGTGAVTQNMQAATLRGDESYSGSRSYFVLKEAVAHIFAYEHTIPTHQGRGSEQLYVPALINKREREKGLDRQKMAAISNYFFDTTQGHTQRNGCKVINVPTEEAFDTSVESDFKGNFDLDKLVHAIEEVGAKNVPYIVSTITCNSAGGQPVSIANLKAVYEIALSYDIPVVMDCARFAENAYLVKQREPEFSEWSIADITKESFKYADILSMSAKKDAMVPMGGLLGFKDDRFSDVYQESRILCVLQEGFPTYGGLEGGAMERLAVGLYDGMREDWLASRLQQVKYLVDGLENIGIECQQAGGHAAFINASKILPHIPSEQFPGHVLACELFKIAGIRSAEIGSLLLGRDPATGEQLPCPTELLRLAIPRATYTQSHLDYVIDAFREVRDNARAMKGLKFTYEPPVLRHFNAEFEPV
ncbi:tryptophanase [Vibrio ostreicida]|uniref:Tryptophanase n=1 Tax=Vibrio ostreicida TaxID=526588 RepID=A0ABT8BUZ3_9VIBR|nr:tryptophanase [Vibrio ostreicida]MDN3609908.1 tryptophanase [Vibrio ostreicida]NPD10027.1 tryptophanase [Vibrio ostreicida]